MIDLDAVFERLDGFIGQRMEAGRLPGMAVALTDRMETLRVSTYGCADLARGAPVAPEMLFEIGSIGKSFTSIALLQEHEAGRLDLDAPVSDYLPWFEVPSPYGPITVHHLLSHTAGISSGCDFSPDSRAQVWALRESEAAWAPGERFHYSNDGYKALGLVLRAITGASYADVIRTRILEPLGMAATDPVITHKTRKRLAVGYLPFYDDRPSRRDTPLVPAPWLETDTGDGCLASTAGDMATYLRMLLKQGEGPKGRILSEESWALLTRRVIETDLREGWWYGYGLYCGDEDGHRILGHGGSMPGFVSAITGDLDAGVGAAVLINGLGGVTAMAEFARQLLRAALDGAPLPDPPPIPDPTRVEKAKEYAGTYRSRGGWFVLRAEDGRLIMEWKGAEIGLEERGQDRFCVPHPDFALFLLRFGREEGQVVEATYGPDWYVNDRYHGPAELDTPPEWSAYIGHYRSFSPWLSNFRVMARKGCLVLVCSVWGWGETSVSLEPAGDARFKLRSAEMLGQIRFGPVVDGRAIAARLLGGEFYCVDTP